MSQAYQLQADLQPQISQYDNQFGGMTWIGGEGCSDVPHYDTWGSAPLQASYTSLTMTPMFCNPGYAGNGFGLGGLDFDGRTGYLAEQHMPTAGHSPAEDGDDNSGKA